MRRRGDPPVWFSAGFVAALFAGAFIPHLSDSDQIAIQLGGFLAGAWWGFLHSAEG